MPEYEHKCTNKECAFEWEDEYSIKQDPPTTCPKCNKETAKRLISGGDHRRGIVELSGDDLVKKVKADVEITKREMTRNEKLFDNMLGNNKDGSSIFHDLQTKYDRRGR